MGGYSRSAVARVFAFPALGGLLFGYDIGATSFVLTQLESDTFSGLGWSGAIKGSAVIQGLVTSGGVGGAFLGAAIVFRVADSLGRRRELLIGAWLYAVGAALEFSSGCGALARSEAAGLAVLVLGRLVYGVGCGFVMHGAPSYIAEMSPPDIRGTLVALKEAAIVVGISLGYAFGYALRETPGGWRYTFGASIPLAAVLFLGCYRLPPSARWLALKGEPERARASLAFVYPDDDDALEAAVAELRTVDSENVFSDRPASLWDARYRRALTAGLGVVLLQQLTGQPSVLYYANSIFDTAGIGTIATVFVGIFKLFATLFAVVTVDRRGRRPLLFIGIGSMLLALTALSVVFYDYSGEGGFNAQKGAIVGLIFVYIAGYQIGFGPIAWLLIAEVFPLEVRGSAIALAVQVNFASNMLVSFLFPVAQAGLKSALGEKWYLTVLFGIFAVIDLYALIFVKKHVPETKGMTLEEIERFLAGPKRASTDGPTIESPLILED